MLLMCCIYYLQEKHKSLSQKSASEEQLAMENNLKF